MTTSASEHAKDLLDLLRFIDSFAQHTWQGEGKHCAFHIDVNERIHYNTVNGGYISERTATISGTGLNLTGWPVVAEIQLYPTDGKRAPLDLTIKKTIPYAMGVSISTGYDQWLEAWNSARVHDGS